MIRRTLVALLLAVALVPATAGAQDNGSIGIRLVDAPTDRRDDPRAQVYIVDHVTQGTTITRHVEVSSTTSEEKEIALYVGGATLQDGTFTFDERGVESDLTDWSTIDPATVAVAPGGKARATVTIEVPGDATDGEHYGVIWAELPGSGGSANVVNRVGVRIYLSVGEGEEPVTDFTIDTLTARRDEKGVPVVETSVTNTGGRAIDLSGELMLTNGPGSLTAGPFDVEIGTTLGPGESAPAFVLLDPTLPDGPWDAVVTIKSGRLEREAEATITFPSEPGESADPVPAESVKEKRRIFLPIALLLLLAVLGGLLWFVFWRRRRKN